MISLKRNEKKANSFNSDWFKILIWLYYDIEIDTSFCCVCMVTDVKVLKTKAHNRDKVMIIRGFKIEKKATESFQIHEYLDCHEDNINLTHLSKKNQNVDKSLDEAVTNGN